MRKMLPKKLKAGNDQEPGQEYGETVVKKKIISAHDQEPGKEYEDTVVQKTKSWELQHAGPDNEETQSKP